MKKFWLLMSFAMVLVLGACGGDSGGDSEEATDEATTEETTMEESTEEETEESTEESDSADAGDSELAQEAFQQNNCVSCHGENLEGASGPALTDVGSRLSEDEIRTTIEEGGNGMPSGLVSDEDEMDALVQWLSTQTGE
ncbi:cytochrome c [Salinicoccus roseus]|uniref:c-type cytochrome n=1 Tax=Salinicoccus roseus TaxID=45670 RepID=UPI001CA6F46C|nr:cytochrome c [Salinicoccus roseus]MBY8909870.1 cytochrome c [Salinicoccus roseus]